MIESKLKYFSLIVSVFLLTSLHSQNFTDFVQTPFSSNIRYSKTQSSQLSFTGFYRFLGFVRNQKEVFPNNSGKTLAILSGDQFREPMLLLKLRGITKEKVTVGADFMLNSLYKGPESINNSLTLELGINLRTSFKTKFGNFNLSSGGVNWYRQSRLTVWGNRSFNRQSLYHRRPQTRLTKTTELRYKSYYDNGLIDDGLRYGNRAFQGIFLQGQNLPFDFSFKGVIGKTPFNRSNFNELSTNYTSCFKINKKINDLNIAYHFLNSTNLVDTISFDLRAYSINTVEFSQKWKSLYFSIEGGFGTYDSPENNFEFGEAIIANLKTSKNKKIPIDFQAYRIASEFVNLTGNFLNTTVLEIFPNVGANNRATTIRPQFNSPMIGLGNHTNNRQGISINAEHSFKKLKINAGIGVSTEIDTSGPSLSYRYNVNSETLSRLYLFARDWGPYNNLNSTYRNVFENVDLVDTNNNGLSNFKKYFNNIEFQAKYNGSLFNHQFYIFLLTRFNSCSKSFTYVPKYNLEMLISQLSNEIDLSLELNENTYMVLNVGIERIIGNNLTERGDNNSSLGSPINLIHHFLNENSVRNFERNQRNTLIGCGIDYKIGDNAMLFLRQNFYKYYDPNFEFNNLKGTETMLELKFLF